MKPCYGVSGRVPILSKLFICFRFYKMPHLIKVVLFTILVVKMRENDAQIFSGKIEFIPNVAEQVIQAGSELQLTCRVSNSFDGDGITWQLTDSKNKYLEVSELNILLL